MNAAQITSRYEAPFLCAPSREEDTITPGQEREIAAGVRGYYMIWPGRGIYIPLVIASRPGSGDVGRFLDALPLDRRIVFPCVMNGKLANMLYRRGFKPIEENGVLCLERRVK